MKLIIEIPDEVVENKNYCQYFGAWSDKLSETIENGTPYFPLLEDVLYKITDAEWEHSDNFWVTTPSGKKIEFEKKRPQGEWIEVKPSQSDLEDGIDYREECSICHEPHRHYGFDEYHDIRFATYYKTNFCPNCGADMRGEENEKT